MITQWLGISWGAFDYWIYALPALIIVGIINTGIFRKRAIIAKKLSMPSSSYTVLTFSRNKNIIKMIIYFLGLIFLCITLLRPLWGKKEEIINQEKREIFILLDISRSMLAQDKKPSRLEFAKEKIKRLVKKLGCERCGLIIFSGSTVVQCPLTADSSAFFMFLQQLDAETISSGTTALDQAIKKAMSVFSTMPAKKNKLVVLCTDGEDFSSNLREIKQEVAAMNMSIFTIGVGTQEGAPIPVVNNLGKSIDHQRDAKGSIVMSCLNEGILQSLANDCGGMYLRATDNDQDINSIVTEVQRFEKEQGEDKKLDIYDEGYPYAAAAALLCFLIEWLL